jgi:hypothetical protein
MFSRELNFDDDLTGLPVSITVQSEPMVDSRDGKVFNRRVFVGLDWGEGLSTAEAYIPREQVKKLITALQEALNG